MVGLLLVLLANRACTRRHDRAAACETFGLALDALRLFVSFPEVLVDKPMIYEMVKRFDVVPNIRRANVEAHSGWVILELSGSHDACDAAIAYLETGRAKAKVVVDVAGSLR